MKFLPWNIIVSTIFKERTPFFALCQSSVSYQVKFLLALSFSVLRGSNFSNALLLRTDHSVSWSEMTYRLAG